MIIGADGVTWSGATEPCIDEVRIGQCGPITIGRYAGASSRGVRTNEDAATAWFGHDWVLATVMDAHSSSTSATLVLQLLSDHQAAFAEALELEPDLAIPTLEARLLAALTGPDFTAHCATTSGETAFLAVATKGSLLWWLSIGDCVAYHLHPDLIALGQCALNTRQFYQWVGQSNSLAATVPAYARGVSRLRSGTNHVLLLTDGLLEFGNRPYERDPRKLAGDVIRGGLAPLYRNAVDGNCDDGATAITWKVDCRSPGLMPTT